MAFDIRLHVDLDMKGRAVCPACQLAKGVGHDNRNLSVSKSGAYKCFRGCTTDDIRAALNEPRDRQIPTALAKPPKNATVTPQKVRESHELLLKNIEAMGWLDDRGIDRPAVVRHKLGLTRAKQGEHHIPSIAIPIPATNDGTQYYQKKRIAPWIPTDKRPKEWSAWSQYGIQPMVYFTHKPDDAKETWLCEGEWDAIRLAMEFQGSTTTAIACFTCGAGNIPPQEQLDRLPGKVTILYDLDEPGEKGAIKVQSHLTDRAFIATVPPPDGDEIPKGWDISDYLNNGGAALRLHAAIEHATPYTIPKAHNPLLLRLKTNDEFMSEAKDYVEWLVPDLLTQDELFIIGMPPRGGKSLFCLTLAKAVATGGNFLDRPVTQGAVIYVNLEDSPTKIKQRQIAQGWSEGLPVYWLDKFKLSELDHLIAIADELPDLRLIVLDTFSRVRDDNQKESSAELGRTLEPLQEFAKERGICILITHHTGKSGGDNPSADPFDMLRGSGSIRATCRGAIVIVPGEHSYRLLAENGYSDQLDINVKVSPETLEWKMLGNWTPRVDGDMRTQILDYLNLNGEGTVSSVSRDLSFNATSVSTILSRLQREGLLEKRAGKGRAPGIYSRSSNLLKQLEAEFEHPNPDGVSDTSLLKQDPFPKVSSEKVINLDKSDHSTLTRNKCDSLVHAITPLITFNSNDHFFPTVPKLFELACNPDGVSDVCSNSETESLSKFEQTGTPPTTATIAIGSKVRYIGSRASMSSLCGTKRLEILAITGDEAEVQYPAWVITQTIPLTDLRLTR